MLDDRPAARELLTNLKRDQVRLAAELDRASGEWGYEDFIYRFWHQSFKVYYLQGETVAMVDALRAVSPGGRPFHPWFEEIIKAGTGLQFEREHNQRWLEVTRPILEAFWHSRFFIEMALKYSQELDEPPTLLPSGWAALLYLYETSTNSDDVPDWSPRRSQRPHDARNKSGIARRKTLPPSRNADASSHSR